MNILPISDVHFEFHTDHGVSFVDALPVNDIDVLVIAGDVAPCDMLVGSLSLFAEKFKKIVYIPGNHEYYGSSRSTVLDALQDAREAAARVSCELHVLLDGENPDTIDDITFVGGTLWFKRSPYTRKGFNDFRLIKDLETWVYDENIKTARNIRAAIKSKNDKKIVVVTHHLPSFKSVAPQWAGSPINIFFVSDEENYIIKDTQPDVWIHGHTHISCDYNIGETRVVCNPLGYANYDLNHKFNERKIIKL